MRITKENLTRYDQHFKSWHRRRLGCANALENWHQTEEAGAVAFYPVGGSPLEGKVKFSFTETPPASGEKSPANPSTINGVSSVNVTRCGKNLFTYPYYDSPQVINDVEWTILSDGSIIANGTAPANARSVFRVTYGKLLPAGTYTLYLNPGIRNVCDAFLLYGSTTIWGNAEPLTFTLSTPQTINCYLRIAVGATVDNYRYAMQLEIGSVRTGFEKGEGADYTIPLGNTYYGGEIDLATGLMTVTHVKVVLTGAEDVSWGVQHLSATTAFSAGALWRPYIPAPKDATNGPVCSHFPFLYSSSSDTTHFYVYSAGGAAFWYPDTDMTEAEWKAYLATQYTNGTPVTLCYEVASPQTIQLSPVQISALAQTSRHEPRLNTVYTDADSIQITYQKSPIRAATEQEMAILGLGGNV